MGYLCVRARVCVCVYTGIQSVPKVTSITMVSMILPFMKNRGKNPVDWDRALSTVLSFNTDNRPCSSPIFPASAIGEWQISTRSWPTDSSVKLFLVDSVCSQSRALLLSLPIFLFRVRNSRPILGGFCCTKRGRKKGGGGEKKDIEKCGASVFSEREIYPCPRRGTSFR